MPSKTEKVELAMAKLPSIPKELIDHFVKGPMTGEAVNEASFAFKRALIERVMGAELSHHLGYVSGEDKPDAATNHRNGATGKTVLTDSGPLRVTAEIVRFVDNDQVIVAPVQSRQIYSVDAP